MITILPSMTLVLKILNRYCEYLEDGLKKISTIGKTDPIETISSSADAIIAKMRMITGFKLSFSIIFKRVIKGLIFFINSCIS